MSGWGFDHIVKAVVVGDSGVGKTSLVLRYTDDIYDSSYMATIGVDFRIKSFERNDEAVKLQVWDTAGQERFRGITRGYYRGAEVVLVCFDVSNWDTFSSLKTWLRDVETYAPATRSTILVGTKSDSQRREVSKEEAQAFAAANSMQYIETSAKDNQSVTEAFNLVVDSAIAQRRVPKPVNDKPSLSLGGSVPAPKERSCFGFWPF
eukprot:TRINITY_DN9802_c0_g1_i1.p1 TRINITY_DN9802_c0_g1~~TRINITY_DN9802_c0_g1_i1.p1  ORF type:complete len:206 (+),score=41.37 TRINITY_DN9802_c0_g1_i1:52-669(+)